MASFLGARALPLALCVVCAFAYADEYSDVDQLARAGKLPAAMAKVDQFLATKPRDPQMRFLKGVIQRDSGKTSEAIATFTRLTEDYPQLPEPYNNLAVLYAAQSQFDKARNALETAIRTNPGYATAHENLGDVYAKLASQSYNKAQQLDTSNQAVPSKLALIRQLFTDTSAKNQRSSPSTDAVLAQSVAATPTPAPVAATAAAATPAGTSGADAEAAVRAWASAWAAKDMEKYLASYGTEFTPSGGASRSDWEAERTKRITSKASITVKLEELNVSVSGNKASAKFRQIYKAGTLSESSRKTLELVKAGERWQIVRESSGG